MEHYYNSMNRKEENDSKYKQTQKQYLAELNKGRTDARKNSESLNTEVEKLSNVIKNNYMQEKENNSLFSRQLIEINKQLQGGFSDYFNNLVEHETKMFSLNRSIVHAGEGGGYLRESYEKMYNSTKNEFVELFNQTNSDNAKKRDEATETLLTMGLNRADISKLTKGFTGNQHDIEQLIHTLEEDGIIKLESSKREEKYQKDNADRMKDLMKGMGDRQEGFTNSMEEVGKKIFGGNEIGGVLGKTVGKNLSQLNPFRMTEDNTGFFGSRLKKVNMALTNKAGGALSGAHGMGEDLNKGIADMFTSDFAKKITSKALQERLEVGALRENEKQDRMKHDRMSGRQAIDEAFTGKSGTFEDSFYASNKETELKYQEDLVFSRMTEEQRKVARKMKSKIPRDLINSERESFDDSAERISDQARRMADIDKVVTGPGLKTKVNPSINSGMGEMGNLNPEGKFRFSSLDTSGVDAPMSNLNRMLDPNNRDPNNPLSTMQTPSNQNPNLINGRLQNEANEQMSTYYGNLNSNRQEDFGIEEPEKKSLKDKVMDKVRSVKSSKENGGLLNKVKGMFMKSGGWIKTAIMSGAGFLKTAIMSGAGLIKSAALGLKGLAPKALSLGKQLLTKSGGLLSSIGTTLMTDVAALGTGTVSAAVTAAAAVGLYSGKKIGEKVYSEETAEKLNIDKSFASDWQKNNSKFWSVDGFFNTQTWKDIGEGLVITSKESINELSGSISTLVDGEGIVSLNNTKELDKNQIKEDNKTKISLSEQTAKNTQDMVKNLEKLNKNLYDVANTQAQREYMSDKVGSKK